MLIHLRLDQQQKLSLREILIELGLLLVGSIGSIFGEQIRMLVVQRDVCDRCHLHQAGNGITVHAQVRLRLNASGDAVPE